MVALKPEGGASPPPSPKAKTARTERRSKEIPALSVIIPTYNEAENILELLKRLRAVLPDVDYEIVVVDDDSPDKTWEIANEASASDPRVKVVRRTKDRGLSSAVLAGMEIALGDVIAVIDGDLQHDETILPELLGAVNNGADISLGSREIDGGSYGEWSSQRRVASWVGAQTAKRLLGTPVTDPMSGYFAVSRQRYLDVGHLANPRGFKLLLEFLARGPRPRVQEVGYSFRLRERGDTKLTSSVIIAYLLALIDLTAGRIMSARFTAYALVGLIGVAVRLASNVTLGSAAIEASVLLAIEVSIVSNYLFNNSFTFSSIAHRGRALLKGCLLFHLVSLYGLLVQAGVSILIDSELRGFEALDWQLSNVPIQLAGVMAATVGNYFLNANLTWRH